MTAEADNVVRSLNFTGRFIDAKLVERPKDYPLDGRTIVLNPNLTPAYVGELPSSFIPAFSSTILTRTCIARAESVVLFQIAGDEGIEDITREPFWNLLGDLLPDTGNSVHGLPFPRGTPLWRGPQDDIGTMEFDPALALGETSSPGVKRTFEVKVNLWFAPAGTDCFIHNQHDFIEIHSQLHGAGRMQKFKTQDHETLYEDLVMSPGYTTPVPFCRTDPDGGFVYPWHQYRADSDCIWLAVEYHALRD